LDEALKTSTTGEAEEELADIVIKSTLLGGVSGAALGSFLNAGGAVPLFGEVVSLCQSLCIYWTDIGF